jgi:hypothetical protein
MKLNTFVLTVAIGVACAFAARGQTNVAQVPNLMANIPVSTALSTLYNAVQNSAILQATNWAVGPYATYAPKSANKTGGGVLAVYNIPTLTGSLGAVGAVLGADWLGSWSLVSGSVTVSATTHPLASLSWLNWLPSKIKNIEADPFSIAGIGAPLSGSSGAAELWDVGYNIDVYNTATSKFGAGLTWGEWLNAGTESGHRYHLFISWKYNF